MAAAVAPPTAPKPAAVGAITVRPPTPGATHLPREVLHDERMTHLVKSAYRCTSGALQKRLREHGLLYGHWTFLRILWQSDGMTQRQLAAQAGVTEASTQTALAAMEKAGYISREKREDNRKEVRVFVTGKGAALRPQILACAHEINESLLAGISPEDIAATRRTLLAMIDNLAREPAMAPATRRSSTRVQAGVAR